MTFSGFHYGLFTDTLPFSSLWHRPHFSPASLLLSPPHNIRHLISYHIYFITPSHAVRSFICLLWFPLYSFMIFSSTNNKSEFVVPITLVLIYCSVYHIISKIFVFKLNRPKRNGFFFLEQVELILSTRTIRAGWTEPEFIMLTFFT